MLEFLLTFNALLMIALPFMLGVLLARFFKVEWRVFLVGVVTFILSQIAHIPFNGFILNPQIGRWGMAGDRLNILGAVLLGLSAGVFEEGARYLVYRFWLKKERSWAEGLMFGAGHGGIEAAWLGGLALYTLFQAMVLRGADLPAVFEDPAQLADVQAQLSAYWSTPSLMAVMGAVERTMAIALHLSASLLVLQAFRRRSLLWLGAAVGWHALVDAVVVYGVGAWGVYAAEGALFGLGIIAVVFIFVLRSPEDMEPLGELDPANLPLPPILGPDDPLPQWERDLDPQDLEDSRYG